MKYARWSSNEEMMKYVKGVNLETGVKASGLPIMYDDKYLYIDDRSAHSLVIGSTGCGKTQSITLPMIKLAMMAGENIVVNDVKGEIYRLTADKLAKYLNIDISNWNEVEVNNSIIINEEIQPLFDRIK